jgi:hypothetical protein
MGLSQQPAKQARTVMMEWRSLLLSTGTDRRLRSGYGNFGPQTVYEAANEWGMIQWGNATGVLRHSHKLVNDGVGR